MVLEGIDIIIILQNKIFNRFKSLLIFMYIKCLFIFSLTSIQILLQRRTKMLLMSIY